MVKTIFILGFSLFAASLRAQTETIPDPRVWAAGLPDSVWLETPGLVRTYSIVPSNPKSVKKWTALSEKLSGNGFLQFIPFDASAFESKLNEKETVQSAEESAAGPAKAKAVPVDIEQSSAQLVLQTAKGKLIGHARNKGAYRVVGKWGYKKPDTASAEDFNKWLVSKLGYDAVVLDVKDDLILAGLLTLKSELGQGLLIRNSAKKVVLQASKVKGDALLQMLRFEGEYAVFESLLSNSKHKILPGTKIILGQSERLQGMMGKAEGKSKPTKAPKAKAAEAEEAAPAPESEAPETEEGAEATPAPQEEAPGAEE